MPTDKYTLTSGNGSVSVVTDTTAGNGTKVLNLTANGSNAKATIKQSFGDNCVSFDFNVKAATWYDGFYIYDKGVEFNVSPGQSNPLRINGNNAPAMSIKLNTWYSGQIAVSNNIAYIKVWAKGKAVPTNWAFSKSLNNIPGTGSVSLEFYGNNETGLLDNVSVGIPTNTYTVNYISKSDTLANIVSANAGSILTAPSDPQRAGYTFSGWYKDYACTTPWNFATDKVTSTMALYAGWRADTTSSSSLN